MRSLIADLGDAYCEELERTAHRPVPARGDADPAAARALREALAFMPERPLTGDEAAAVAQRAAPAGARGRHRAPSRLTHDGELLAIAECGRARPSSSPS